MAARKQLVFLQSFLKVNNVTNTLLQPSYSCSCISYQQKRYKKYYNTRERPQKEPWHVEQQLKPALYDPLTEDSRHILEDEYVRKHVEVSPLRVEQAPRNTWTSDTRRVGVLAIKIGIQPLWKKDGTKIYCNVLQVLDNHMIKYIPPEEYQQYPSYHPKWLETRSTWGAAVVGAISCNPWNAKGENADLPSISCYGCQKQVLDNHMIKYIPPEEYQQYPSYHPKWLETRSTWGAAVVGAISCNPWNAKGENADLPSISCYGCQKQVLDNHMIKYIPPEEYQQYPSYHPKWLETRSTWGAAVVGAISCNPWNAKGEKADLPSISCYGCQKQVLDNHMIKYIPPEEYQQYPSYHPKWLETRSTWGAAVVGAISCNPWNFDEDYVSLFTKSGVPPKRRLTRFMVTPDAVPSPGTPLTVNHFNIGEYVDCSARTVDHGFQGAMKRWGFSGQPASHGHTKSHRSPGTLKSGRKTGVWAGTKMPGMMGDRWNVHKGLKIWRINYKYNVMYVSFGVPGPIHAFVRVYDSSLYKHIKRREENPEALAMPTRYPDDFKERLPEEVYDDEIFQMNSPSITFANES